MPRDDTLLALHGLATALEELRANVVVVLGNAPCQEGFSLEDHWDAATLAAVDALAAATQLQRLQPHTPAGDELVAVVSLVVADLGALDANRLGHARIKPDEAARYASLLPFSIIAAIERTRELTTRK